MRDSVSGLSLWVALAAAATFAAPPALARSGDCPLTQLSCVVFIPLGDLSGGSFRSEVYGVSQDGWVAVGLSNSTAAPSSGEAFRWEASVMEALGSLPGGSATSRATGIQKTGSSEWIVGDASSSSTGSNSREAFLYSAEDATFTGLGSLPGGSNQSGANTLAAIQPPIVVGQSSSADAGSNGSEAFIFHGEDDLMSGLGSLPGGLFSSSASSVSAVGSVVVGASSSAASGVNATEAFRWEAGDMEGLGFLSGGLDSSSALAVNSAGDLIVGSSSSEASGTNASEAFLWQGGAMQGLGDLPGGSYDSAALAVSRRGVVVGRGHTEAGPRAFIWSTEDGIRDLRDVFETASGTDLGLWQLHEATAISASGRIVAGNGLNSNNLPEAWILSLPEPGAAWLPAVALACLAALARRRGHSALSTPRRAS